MRRGDVEIEFRDERVRRDLTEMAKRGSRMHSVFRNLRNVLRDDLRAAAASETSPLGAWPARSLHTAERHAKRGGRTFVRRQGRRKVGAERRRKISGARVAGPLRQGALVSGPRREWRDRQSSPHTLGLLPGGIYFNASPVSVQARSPVKWAGVHNVGGRVGHGAVIPARPFIFFSPPFMKRAHDEIVAFVVAGWGR